MKNHMKDERYFSYLTPRQAKTERFLNALYLTLMIGTFVAAFVITGLSPRDDSTMTFIGMIICEVCLIILKKGTIPLFEIRFDDYHAKPGVTVRDNVVLLWVGLSFMMFIGYLMMAVGVVNFFIKLKETAQ